MHTLTCLFVKYRNDICRSFHLVPFETQFINIARKVNILELKKYFIVAKCVIKATKRGHVGDAMVKKLDHVFVKRNAYSSQKYGELLLNIKRFFDLCT